MAIYFGDKKISGAGVQVDDVLSQTSTRPVQNKVVTDALEDVGYSTWQKPSDWIDIRSGAFPNSVYFLVGHSEPTESGGTYTVATYPRFDVNTTVSTSANTYDVYVDGLKVATTASGTTTTLDWGTLYTNGTIIGGNPTTYPSELITHIVRVTPTVSTDTLTAISMLGTGAALATASELGVLWAHFSINNQIGLENFSGYAGTNAYAKTLILEAITADNDTIKISSTRMAFSYCTSLKYIPVLEGDGVNHNGNMGYMFRYCYLLKKIRLRNILGGTGNSGYMFLSCNALTEIKCENTKIIPSYNQFEDCYALKKLPTFRTGVNIYNGSLASLLVGCTSLQDTFLDLSSYSNVKRITFGGSSSKKLLGIKGLVVSSSSPFDGASPQLSIQYTGLNRVALVNLFNSLPTVTDSQVCDITGCTGAADLTASDLAIATGKGWTVTR